MSEVVHGFWRKFGDWMNSTAKMLGSFAVIFGSVSFFAAPVVAPYLDIPNKLDSAIVDIEKLSVRVSSRENLEFIAYRGNGTITSQNDSYVEIIYLLQRKVDCDADLTVKFLDVDKSFFTYVKKAKAVKSPVTSEFVPFKVRVSIPPELESGRYSYIPVLEPIDCGVYAGVTMPASDIFVVNRK